MTLWKKGTRQLNEYLDDKRVSIEDKEKTCKRVVELVAKLHLAGFGHGHIHGRNVLIDGRNQPILCDPRLLQKKWDMDAWHQRKRDFIWTVKDEKVNFFEWSGQKIHYSRNITYEDKLQEAKRFEQELEAHYHAHYEKLTSK